MLLDIDWIKRETDRTFDLFFANGETRELRAFGVKKSEFEPRAKYFAVVNDKDAALDIIYQWEQEDARGIYFTLNPVNPESYEVELNVEHRLTEGVATNDQRVLSRQYILIDIDPIRPTDTSSTEEEHKNSQIISKRIVVYLKGKGWPLPIQASSGNGTHLLYAVQNDPKVERYLSKFLRSLASMFNSHVAEIDIKVFDRPRITRFYGTTTRKGEDTQERPHRNSALFFVPSKQVPVTAAQIEEIANLLPEEPSSKPGENLSTEERFHQLDLWIRRHELENQLSPPRPYEGGGRKWIFKVCPFNAEHKDDSAFLIQFESGAIIAGCLHKSCAAHGWETLKEKYGPLKEKTKVSESEEVTTRLGTDQNENWSTGSMLNVADFNALPPIPPSLTNTPAGPAGTIALTDMGNARRFTRLHGNDVRYVRAWDQWLVWNGVRWTIDDVGHIDERCKATVHSIRAEAIQTSNQTQSEQTLKWALKSQAAGRIAALKSLACSEHPIAANADVWDTDPFIINLRNGIFDLEQRQLIPHDKDALCTKVAPVAYDAAATCPNWEKFLLQIMSEDKDVVAYIQRIIGYSLTASTAEQAMFFLVGSGANGKSTFLSVLRTLMGSYAKVSAPELITVNRVGDSKHPAGVADLHKARMVVCQESEKGSYLSESLVKQLTGEEVIKARKMHQDWFEFVATHKLFMATNHKPVVRGTDNGIWRRLHVIPFDVVIPKEKQDPDLHFKLMREASGILNWCIEGYYAWRERGLAPPRVIKEAVSDYRESMDSLGEFISRECIVKEGLTVLLSDIYDYYTTFTMQRGDIPMKLRTFSATLEERNFKKKRIADGMCFLGIGLLAQDN